MMRSDPQALVHSVQVPEEARALCTLERIDYDDATVVEVGETAERTAEQWMRGVFDDPPETLRLRLWSAWRMLGLRLGSPFAHDLVLGWRIELTTPDTALLGARSHIGMPAQLLLLRRTDSLLFDTFVEQGNPLARATWRAIEPAHRRTVPAVLEAMARRPNRRRCRD